MKIKNINSTYKKLPNYPTKVIQFGEGNFLRAFIDWQIQQMNKKNIFNGGVAIVQPLNVGRTHQLDDQDDLYTVLLEGKLDGLKIKSNEIIENINKTVRPYENYDSYLSLAENDDIQIIISNTTEAGIAFDVDDKLEDSPQKSYPGKLTALLYKRFKLNKSGFYIVPCELINHNGDVLKKIIIKYAKLWNLGPDFINWINNSNKFYSTLVDRIVPGYPADQIEEIQNRLGYRDDNIVKAEPFMLFVIEGDEELEKVFPLKKAGLNVVFTNNLQPYRDRKVSLLNGPHTSMNILGQLMGIRTVTEVMNNKVLYQFISDEMQKEIMPTINLSDKKLMLYSDQVKERFDNPFIEHELKSIGLNSISKIKTRLLPILKKDIEEFDEIPSRITLVLAAYIYVYSMQSEITPQDTNDVLEKFRELSKSSNYIELILSNEYLWGEDLTSYPELLRQVINDINLINEYGVKRVIEKINNEVVNND